MPRALKTYCYLLSPFLLLMFVWGLNGASNRTRALEAYVLWVYEAFKEDTRLRPAPGEEAAFFGDLYAQPR